MNTTLMSHPRRLGQRLFSQARALLAVSALAALAVPSQSFALTLPPPVDLGPAQVTGVAPGYVVGYSYYGNSASALVWSAAAKAKLEIPPPPNCNYIFAAGVNSRGEVVGLYQINGAETNTAFYWSQATGIVPIGSAGNIGLSINENGVVAGIDANSHLFRWTRAGGLVDLGGTGATLASAEILVSGLNARGDIIGNSGGDAFVAMASANTLTMLRSPGIATPPTNAGYTENLGNVNIQVSGINDSGVVVGTYWDFNYIYYGYDISEGGFFSKGVHNSHAFKWTATGGFTDLSNLGTWKVPGNPNPIFAARATAINNAGTIVGYSYLSAGNNYVPFVCTTTMTPLPKLNAGDDYAAAFAINDDGVVAGWSGGGQSSVLWDNGVPTNVTPSFAGPYSGSPLIKGSTVAGNGNHAWTFAIPAPQVTDTTPPVITSPGNLVAEAAGPNGKAVTFTVTATDNVDGAVPVIASPVSGSTFPIGTSAVGLAASDAARNTATASFTVTVQDTTAPGLSVPANVVAEATSASGAIVTYANANATDAVSVPSVTYSQNSGTQFPLGVTTVNVTAKDAANNARTLPFTIMVKDTLAPVITVPASQTLESTSAAGAVATFSASASDAVGVTSLTYSKASSSTFAIGTTTVTVTAKDAAGNTSTGSFTITVKDTTAPVIASVTPSSATLWPPNHQMVAISVNAVAADLVGVASLKIISVTSSEPDNGLGDGDTANDIQITGDLTVNLRAERSGGGNGRTYTITVQAVYAAGNRSALKTCTVFVPKSQGGK